MLVWVLYFNLARGLEIFCCNLASALGHERYGLRLIAVEDEMNTLQIQKDFHDRLTYAVNGGEFVWDALYLHLRDGRAGERGKDDAAERIAECVAVARVERVNFINALQTFFGNNAGLTRKCNVVFHNSIVVTN